MATSPVNASSEISKKYSIPQGVVSTNSLQEGTDYNVPHEIVSPASTFMTAFAEVSVKQDSLRQLQALCSQAAKLHQQQHCSYAAKIGLKRHQQKVQALQTALLHSQDVLAGTISKLGLDLHNAQQKTKGKMFELVIARSKLSEVAADLKESTSAERVAHSQFKQSDAANTELQVSLQALQQQLDDTSIALTSSQAAELISAEQLSQAQSELAVQKAAADEAEYSCSAAKQAEQEAHTALDAVHKQLSQLQLNVNDFPTMQSHPQTCHVEISTSNLEVHEDFLIEQPQQEQSMATVLQQQLEQTLERFKEMQLKLATAQEQLQHEQTACTGLTAQLAEVAFAKQQISGQLLMAELESGNQLLEHQKALGEAHAQVEKAADEQQAAADLSADLQQQLTKAQSQIQELQRLQTTTHQELTAEQSAHKACLASQADSELAKADLINRLGAAESITLATQNLADARQQSLADAQNEISELLSQTQHASSCNAELTEQLQNAEQQILDLHQQQTASEGQFLAEQSAQHATSEKLQRSELKRAELAERLTTAGTERQDALDLAGERAQKLADANKQVIKLLAEQQAEAAQFAELSQQFQAAKESISEAQHTQTTTEQLLEAEKALKNELAAKLSRTKLASSEQLDVLRLDRQGALDSVDSLKLQLADKESQLSKFRADQQTDAANIQSLSEKVSRTQTQAQELSAQLHAVSVEKQSALDSSNGLQRQLANAQRQLSNMRADRQAAARSRQTAAAWEQKTIQQLQSQLSTEGEKTQKADKAAEAAAKQLSTTTQNLQRQLSSAGERTQKAEIAAEAAAKQMTALSQDKDQAMSSVDALEKSLSEAQSQLSKLESEKQAAATASQADAAANQKLIKQLQVDLETAQQSITATSSAADATAKQIHELEQQKQAALDSAKQLEASVTDVHSQLQAEEQAGVAAQNQITKLQFDLSNAQQSTRIAEAEAQKHEVAVYRLRAQLSKMDRGTTAGQAAAADPPQLLQQLLPGASQGWPLSKSDRQQPESGTAHTSFRADPQPASHDSWDQLNPALQPLMVVVTGVPNAEEGCCQPKGPGQMPQGAGQGSSRPLSEPVPIAERSESQSAALHGSLAARGTLDKAAPLGFAKLVGDTENEELLRSASLGSSVSSSLLGPGTPSSRRSQGQPSVPRYEPHLHQAAPFNGVAESRRPVAPYNPPADTPSTSQRDAFTAATAARLESSDRNGSTGVTTSSSGGQHSRGSGTLPQQQAGPPSEAQSTFSSAQTSATAWQAGSRLPAGHAQQQSTKSAAGSPAPQSSGFHTTHAAAQPSSAPESSTSALPQFPPGFAKPVHSEPAASAWDAAPSTSAPSASSVARSARAPVAVAQALPSTAAIRSGRTPSNATQQTQGPWSSLAGSLPRKASGAQQSWTPQASLTAQLPRVPLQGYAAAAAQKMPMHSRAQGDVTAEELQQIARLIEAESHQAPAQTAGQDDLTAEEWEAIAALGDHKQPLIGAVVKVDDNKENGYHASWCRIARMPNGVFYMDVRGDGNCGYRAIGVSLVTVVAQLPRDQQMAFGRHIDGLYQRMQSGPRMGWRSSNSGGSVSNGYRAFKAALRNEPSANRQYLGSQVNVPSRELITLWNNAQVSDSVVLFLRALAAYHMAANEHEYMTTHQALFDGSRPRSVLEFSRSYVVPFCEGANAPDAPPRYADACNTIRAIAHACKVKIVVADGNSVQPFGVPESQHNGHAWAATAKPLLLLQSSNHFAAAFM